MNYIEEYKKLELIKVDKKIHNVRIKEQTKITHKCFIEKNKLWIRTLDIIAIIVILLNYGAVFMTNALVIKENPEVKLQEANQVQAQMNDYEYHDNGKEVMRAILIQTLLWVVLVSVYISNRYMLITYTQLTVMTIAIVYFAFLLTLDFVNNFGYLIGSMLWGN